ncbi:hypothetical protein BaRGS_00014390, partial [Batillaria attramentaria]
DPTPPCPHVRQEATRARYHRQRVRKNTHSSLRQSQDHTGTTLVLRPSSGVAAYISRTGDTAVGSHRDHEPEKWMVMGGNHFQSLEWSPVICLVPSTRRSAGYQVSPWARCGSPLTRAGLIL